MIMITINAKGAYMKKIIFYVISVLVYTAYKTTQPTRAVKIHKAINIIKCSTRLQQRNTNRIKYSYHPARKIRAKYSSLILPYKHL